MAIVFPRHPFVSCQIRVHTSYAIETTNNYCHTILRRAMKETKKTTACWPETNLKSRIGGLNADARYAGALALHQYPVCPSAGALNGGHVRQRLVVRLEIRHKPVTCIIHMLSGRHYTQSRKKSSCLHFQSTTLCVKTVDMQGSLLNYITGRSHCFSCVDVRQKIPLER